MKTRYTYVVSGIHGQYDLFKRLLEVIDSGVVYTNMLGALRLEDMKELYVSNKIAINRNI